MKCILLQKSQALRQGSIQNILRCIYTSDFAVGFRTAFWYSNLTLSTANESKGKIGRKVRFSRLETHNKKTRV
jgi:hypothetical protein